MKIGNLNFNERKYMTRYIKDIYLEQPEEIVEQVMNTFIEQNNFKHTLWNGEICWGASHVIVGEIYFFKYLYDNGTLHIEAWIRNGKTKEMGLTGWEASDLKKPYYKLIWNLIKRLLALIPAESDLLEKNRDLFQDNKKQKRSHITSGIVIFLLLLLMELLRWMIKSGYL